MPQPPVPPPRIRVSEAVMSDAEVDAVTRVIRSGRLSQGDRVLEFEHALGTLFGAPHVVACNSGTAALHLALLGAGVLPTDLVIVPALTYVATANAVAYCGASVVFADVDPDMWTIDHASVNEIVAWARKWRHPGSRTFVIPVDLYDSLANTLSFTFTFDAEKVDGVILDASHSMRTVSSARATTFSFFPSKLITTGEGGAVLCSDPQVAARMRLYRGQGTPATGKYHHTVIGYNYRMTEIAAAIGLAQLANWPRPQLAYRRHLSDRYRAHLTGVPGIGLQDPIAQSNGWAFAVTVPNSADRVRERLAEDGIETRPFFEPLNGLPMYRESDRGDDSRRYRGAVAGFPTPVAYDLYRRGIVLPLHNLLTYLDVDHVCERLIAAVKETA